MPYNGSGGFTRVRNWQADAAAGIKILANLHDSEDDNLASGLSSVICRDGQSQISADIPWNGHKITGLANPTNPQDAATKAYADAIRNFSTAIVLTGASTGVAPNQVSTAFVGYTEADMAVVGRQAGSPAASVKRIAYNDKVDGTGTDVWAVDETGAAVLAASLTVAGRVIKPAWEELFNANLAAVASQPILNLANYKRIRICGQFTVSNGGTSVGLQFSTDNGVTWITAATEYNLVRWFNTTTVMQVAVATVTSVQIDANTGITATAPGFLSFTIEILNLNQATQTTGQVIASFRENGAAGIRQTGTNFETQQRVVMNALRFLPTAGTISGQLLVEGSR